MPRAVDTILFGGRSPPAREPQRSIHINGRSKAKNVLPGLALPSLCELMRLRISLQ